MLIDCYGDFTMNINTVTWKEWKCRSHIDGLGNIIIDDWTGPGSQPTTAQIQTASDDYDAHLVSQDSKYIQYLSKISDLDYDQIDNYVDNITNLAGAKVLMKRMAFAIVALVNILKEERSVK